MSRLRLCALIALAASLVGPTLARAADAPTTQPALTPIPGVPTGHRPASTQPAEHNAKRHAKNLARVREGRIDLLFMGDSITEGWRDNAVWQEYYAKLNAANFGISGDTTQNVLWRVLDGEVDPKFIQPKVIVLLIGTNNVGSDSSEDIAAGIAACVRALRAKAPASRVLLLGIFPSQGAGSKWRKQIAQINSIAARLDDGDKVRYLDIGDRFIDKEGNFLPGAMKDKTHPAEPGYRLWAQAMQPLLSEMMSQPPPTTQPETEYRRGAAPPQTGPLRPNPPGRRVLRSRPASLVVDDIRSHIDSSSTPWPRPQYPSSRTA
ncbi:MAG: hypothetical protein BIFFINMI_00019 [Phycisphaerae bacterium]|nr:hypothetical protein [Phycisphaerae bacterium]